MAYNFNPFNTGRPMSPHQGLARQRMSNPTPAPVEEKGDNTVSTLMQALQLYSGLKGAGAGTPTGATPSRFGLAPAEKPTPYSLAGLSGQPQATQQPHLTGLRSLNPEGRPQSWWDRMGEGGQQAFTRGLLTAGSVIGEKTNPDSVMTAVSTGAMEGVNVYDQVRAAQAQQDMARRAEERATTEFGWKEGEQARAAGLRTRIGDVSLEGKTPEEYYTGLSNVVASDDPMAGLNLRKGALGLREEQTYPYTVPSTGVEVPLGAKDYLAATKVDTPKPDPDRWKLIVDKSSTTGYSYQDLNEPTSIRREAPAPREGTTVNVGDRSVAKEIGPIMVASMQKATDAVNQLDIGNRIDTAIKSGTVISGPGTTPRMWLAQLAQVVSPGAGNEGEALANTRNVIRGLAQYGIAARGALKGSGQISDFESKSLIKAEAGEVDNLTIPEIKAIVAVTNRAAKISIMGHNRQLENMRKNPDMASMAPFYEVPDYYSETPLPGAATTGGSKFDKFMK